MKKRKKNSRAILKTKHKQLNESISAGYRELEAQRIFTEMNDGIKM